MSREIDALIAEHVMGWKGVAPVSACVLDMAGINPEYPQVPQIVPYYSTDIAAAWEVVERLSTEFYHSWSLHLNNGRQYHEFKFVPPKEMASGTIGPSHWVESDTAPLAICLAALKAKGIDYDNL